MLTQLEILQLEQPSLILAFRNLRGKFTYLGLRKINSFAENLFPDENEEQWLDASGNEVGCKIDNDGIGRIEFDASIHNVYTTYFSDIDEKEFFAIKAEKTETMAIMLLDVNDFND
jgi:hypothetical protein